MNLNVTIDDKVCTVLGFGMAGWSLLTHSLAAQGKHVLTSTVDIIPKKDSIYWSAHYESSLRNKSLRKKKEPESVVQALGKIAEILLEIKEPDTRKKLLSYFIVAIYQEDLAKLNTLLEEIEQDEEPNQRLLAILCAQTDNTNPKIKKKSTDELYELSGYSIAKAFRDDEVQLAKIFTGADCQLLDSLREWSNHSNLIPVEFDIQYTLAQSKAAITDTLQRNLQLLQEGRPLIPINMVIESNNAKTSVSFVPDWRKATQKEGNFYTLAELRMIYKLKEELGDPLIKELLDKTVFFLKKTNSGFEPTQPPWQQQPQLWHQRKRTAHKQAYNQRDPKEMSPWLNELLQLARETAHAINYDYNELEIERRPEPGSVGQEDDTALISSRVPR